MNISRRRLMQMGLAGGAVAAGSSYWLQSLSRAAHRWDHAKFVNKLKIPPLLEGTKQGSGKQFNLSVRSSKAEFFDGVATPAIGVNGPYLGPTMRFKSGERVTINVANRLGMDTTVHWHGLHVPAKADGGPHQVVKPGATWSPSFEVKQKAALFWYHSHLMGYTGAQVNQGLAGLILVDDDENASLDLPTEYGIDDIPLVVQDRRFNDDGSFAYLTSMHDRMMGFKGNTLLVNGTVRPYLAIRRQRTRLRLLNGSNSRIYNFGFEDDRSFLQIASDGSLLEHPVQRRRLRLGPGERAEVLVDMQANSRVLLMSFPDTPSGGGMMGGMMRGMAGNNETFPVLELKAERIESSKMELPRRLTDVANWHQARAHRTRHFDLNMPMMGMMGGRGSMAGGMMGINGKALNIDRIDERVPLGAIEIWQIRNDTPVVHPFHIHDIQFRILDRNGRAHGAHEAGLKDTVLVDPGEIVRVITEFTDYADPDRPYMYHCHILEHEDAGMMGQFVVTA